MSKVITEGQKELLSRMPGLQEALKPSDKTSDIKKSLRNAISHIDDVAFFLEEILDDIKNNPNTRSEFEVIKEKTMSLRKKLEEIQKGIDSGKVLVQ